MFLSFININIISLEKVGIFSIRAGPNCLEELNSTIGMLLRNYLINLEIKKIQNFSAKKRFSLDDEF